MGKFEEADKADPALKEPDKPEVYYSDDDDIPEEDDAVPKMSKKKRKMQSKLSVAELKALVKKPETVDWTDTDAADPRLLVHIKSYRNVVPVPSHWALKREYLSSKRGVEKPPFALPKFIQETGIAEMRDAVLEKQDQASLKQRQRERVAPKMGKLDIDYQKLYEAFFRFQTKPELTRFGEVYYEGKEYETNLRHLRPGELSDELKEALNIPPGAPPPWLINQQRYGPPPSYPALKIPGSTRRLPLVLPGGFTPVVTANHLSTKPQTDHCTEAISLAYCNSNKTPNRVNLWRESCGESSNLPKRSLKRRTAKRRKKRRRKKNRNINRPCICSSDRFWWHRDSIRIRLAKAKRNRDRRILSPSSSLPGGSRTTDKSGGFLWWG